MTFLIPRGRVLKAFPKPREKGLRSRFPVSRRDRSAHVRSNASSKSEIRGFEKGYSGEQERLSRGMANAAANCRLGKSGTDARENGNAAARGFANGLTGLRERRLEPSD
jgi:hypothetical protein